MQGKKLLVFSIALIILAVSASFIWNYAKSPTNDQTTDENNGIIAEPPSPTPGPTPAPEPQPVPPPVAQEPSSPESAATEADIITSNWLIHKVTVNGALANMDVNVPQALTLNFDGNKKYSGFAGCNSYSGTYTASAPDKFAFGASVSTKKYCVDSSELENDVFEAMGKIQKASFTKEGDLILQSNDGKYKIQYKVAI